MIRVTAYPRRESTTFYNIDICKYVDINQQCNTRKDHVVEVKILGMGCARCNSLEKMVRDVVAEQDIDATVNKVTQQRDILAYPVFAVPALVIDEEVKAFGRLPSKKEIADWLIQAQQTQVKQ
jgi:small redox-active disulfide protein 2